MHAANLLSRHNIFRSRKPKEVEDSISLNLCPHNLRIHGQDIDTIHNRVCLPGSELSFVRYGASVQVTKARVADSYLLITGHSGKSRLQMRQHEIVISDKVGAIVPPDTPVAIDGDEDASALVWKIKQYAIEKQASVFTGAEPDGVVNFSPSLCLNRGPGEGFARVLYFLASELDAAQSILHNPPSLGLMEQSLMTALLQIQPNDLRDRCNGGYGRIAPACVRQVEAYILAHPAEDISVEDLVRVSGVSARTLFRVFRHFRQMSPMAYLRSVRLRGVRADLLSPSRSDLTVTDVMSRWGVSQFGRFASEYKRKYGELPSQTLRSATVH